ncbi:formin-like protein 3 [Sarcophilus harrisii]|uniref:formin-like protein 3 n=1 Tax=Sarcophilus harrisii TaxID=9305 RepID=UPI001301FE79|nr:formin-like protein 3 [Sarcophilus harrisii]
MATADKELSPLGEFTTLLGKWPRPAPAAGNHRYCAPPPEKQTSASGHRPRHPAGAAGGSQPGFRPGPPGAPRGSSCTARPVASHPPAPSRPVPHVRGRAPRLTPPGPPPPPVLRTPSSRSPGRLDRRAGLSRGLSPWPVARGPWPAGRRRRRLNPRGHFPGSASPPPQLHIRELPQGKSDRGGSARSLPAPVSLALGAAFPSALADHGPKVQGHPSAGKGPLSGLRLEASGRRPLANKLEDSTQWRAGSGKGRPPPAPSTPKAFPARNLSLSPLLASCPQRPEPFPRRAAGLGLPARSWPLPRGCFQFAQLSISCAAVGQLLPSKGRPGRSGRPVLAEGGSPSQEMWPKKSLPGCKNLPKGLKPRIPSLRPPPRNEPLSGARESAPHRGPPVLKQLHRLLAATCRQYFPVSGSLETRPSGVWSEGLGEAGAGTGCSLVQRPLHLKRKTNPPPTPPPQPLLLGRQGSRPRICSAAGWGQWANFRGPAPLSSSVSGACRVP